MHVYVHVCQCGLHVHMYVVHIVCDVCVLHMYGRGTCVDILILHTCAVCVGTCLAGGTVCVHVHPMGPLCRTMDTNMFKTAQSLAKPHKVAEWELYMALTTWLLTDHRQVCV